MKVLLIGCGTHGTSLACLLAKEGNVSQLILADMDEGKARQAMEIVKDTGTDAELEVKQLDASEKENVARVGDGVGFIFNGTFPEFNIPIMEAALEVGAHYSDWLAYPFKLPGIPDHGTMDAQLELDDKFSSTNLTALVSMGIAPGWTDMAARYIADQLDSVEEIMVRMGGKYDSKVLVAPFTPEVLMSEWFGAPHPICVDRGEIKKVDLLDSAETFEFPEPMGIIELYTVTLHTEVKSIPQFIGKPVDYIEVKNAVDVGKWPMKDVWIKAISEQTGKHPGPEKIKMMELFGRSFLESSNLKEARAKGLVKGGCSGFSVEVIGKKDGAAVCHTVSRVVSSKDVIERRPWAGQRIYTTAIPAFVTMKMIANGEIAQRGVFGGSALENPKVVLDKIQEFGGITVEKIERTLS